MLKRDLELENALRSASVENELGGKEDYVKGRIIKWRRLV